VESIASINSYRHRFRALNAMDGRKKDFVKYKYIASPWDLPYIYIYHLSVPAVWLCIRLSPDSELSREYPKDSFT